MPPSKLSITRPYTSYASTPRRRCAKKCPAASGTGKRVMLRIPTSTAETVTNAPCPASCGTLTVTGRSLLGPHRRGQRQTHRDLALAAVHRHVRDPDRARRGDPARRAATAEHQRGDVDVVTLPVPGDRNLERAAGLGVDLLHVEHAVALDHQQPLAGVGRGQRDLQRVAGPVGGPVEGHLDLVGARVEATVPVVPAPAGGERIARGELRRRVVDVDAIVAPLHREMQPQRRRACVDGARLDVLEASGEVVVPAVVAVVPVVVAVLAHQRHAQAFGGSRRAIAAEARDLETGVGVGVAALLVVEQRAHADQRIGRPQHAREAAIDAAAAGFVHAAGNDRGDRADRFRFRRQRDVLQQATVRIELRIDDVGRLLRQRQRRIAEEVTGQLFERVLFHLDRELRGEAVARGGRAVEIGAVHAQAQRLAGAQRRRRVEVEFQALGQEFLDAQRHALHRVLAARIGPEFHAPAPRRGIGRDELRVPHVALRIGLKARFEEGLAVRLHVAQEQRLQRLAGFRGDRLAVVVAQQRRHAHGFAGTVQIAAGPGEHVEPCLLATAHRELRQVQRRLVERQHRHVLPALRDQHVSGIQPVTQQRVAVAVGLALQHRLALRVEHAQFHARDRRAVLQRGRVHEQRVLVGARVQAQVADGEERGLELVLELTGTLHHREVEARFLQFADVLQRQVGQHALIGLAAEHEAVDVDRFGQPFQRRLLAVLAAQFPAAAPTAALVVGEEARELVLLHAQEFDVDLRHVDRHHRQAAAFAGRQHAALRGEAHHRIERSGVNLSADFLADALTGRGRDPRLEDHDVIAAGLHVRKAQHLRIVRQHPAALHHRALGVGHRRQRVEGLRAYQRATELQRDRERLVALLVGIGGEQREARDILPLRLDRLAADRRQLPVRIAPATTGRERHGERRDDEPPAQTGAEESFHSGYALHATSPRFGPSIGVAPRCLHGGVFVR